MNTFNAEDASTVLLYIIIVQKLLREPSTRQNVLYIAKSFSSISDSIKQLEKQAEFKICEST